MAHVRFTAVPRCCALRLNECTIHPFAAEKITGCSTNSPRVLEKTPTGECCEAGLLSLTFFRRNLRQKRNRPRGGGSRPAPTEAESFEGRWFAQHAPEEEGRVDRTSGPCCLSGTLRVHRGVTAAAWIPVHVRSVASRGRRDACPTFQESRQCAPSVAKPPHHFAYSKERRAPV